MRAAQRRITLETFWQHVDADDATGCWLWLGYVARSGYGRAWFAGREWPAHRLAYELAGNKVPVGHHVHHKCENKRCCRPSHLMPVTPLQHAHAHGRTARHWCWRFILRRPATGTVAASHFGVVGLPTRWQALAEARRWSVYYPTFTVWEIDRYEVTADGCVLTAAERRSA
jgi:hypothetical protein